MVNTGYNLFDPFDGIKIPAQLENDVKLTIVHIFQLLWD